jgi:AcrR family transcriptional regulator
MKSARPPDALLHRMFDIQLSKGDLKRIEIIEAAIHCLATHGIEETSLDAIGKQLKISRSHIIYYFKDREALLDAVVKYVTQTGQNLFVERLSEVQGSPETLLTAYVHAVFDWVEKYEPHVRFMLLFSYFCVFHAKYRGLHTQMRDSARHRIEAIIAPLLARGAPEAAEAIQCALIGYYTEFLTTDRRRALPAWRKAALKTALGIVEKSKT